MPILEQDMKTFLFLFRSDLQRRLKLERRRYTLLNCLLLLLKPGVMTVSAFRCSTWLAANHLKLIAKLVELVQYIATGSSIHMGAEIGPGLVISDLKGIGIPRWAQIGKNCTILGPASLTIGGMEHIDLENDRIVVGDHCVIGSGVRILGAVSVPSETQIKPNSVVVTSFSEPGLILSGIPARRRGSVPPGRLALWNPLRAEFHAEPSSPLHPQELHS